MTTWDQFLICWRSHIQCYYKHAMGYADNWIELELIREELSMKPHYFEQTEPDFNDIHIRMAIEQGYVPKTCLLNGLVVMGEINAGKDPCAGCNGPRFKCHGRPFKGAN